MLQFPMFGSWNIRGLNGYSKQRAVKSWISDCSLSLIGLLETKVALGHLDSVVSKICPSWHYISNASNSVACRVLVCWDPVVFSITSLIYLLRTSLVKLLGWLMAFLLGSLLCMGPMILVVVVYCGIF